MFELVVLACLSASPGQCSFHTIGSGKGQASCAASVQLTASKWAGDHPAYEIRKIICRPAGIDA